MRIWISGCTKSLVHAVAASLFAVSGMVANGAGPGSAPPSGQSPPKGHYGCFSAPVEMAGGPGYGDVIYGNRVPEGDVWINSDHDYAGPNDKQIQGTYTMDGRTLVAKTGAFAPPGPKTRVTFTPSQGKDKASLYIVYFDEKGRPNRASECVWSDPLP